MGGIILSQRWCGISACRALEEVFIFNVSVNVTDIGMLFLLLLRCFIHSANAVTQNGDAMADVSISIYFQ